MTRSRQALALLVPTLLAGALLAGCGGSGAGDEAATVVLTETVEVASPPEVLTETVEVTPADSEPTESEPAETAAEPELPRGTEAVVERVVDGDTVELRNGREVRLVQIDAPEPGDCHGAESSAALEELVPPGTRVLLRRDPGLEDVDELKRFLRYVFVDDLNVNLALVQRGTASVWFTDRARGALADRLLQRARAARKAKRGLWGQCAEARLTPNKALESGSA